MTTAATTSTHSHPAVGDRFVGGYGPVRIMAIAEGWALMRSEANCLTFCVDTNGLMSSGYWQLQCDICHPEVKLQPAPPAEAGRN